jgi:hypothetical protein
MLRVDYIINELINKLDDAEIKLIIESVKKKRK